MPPRIDLNKCNGCGGKPETACEMVCPGDLMMLDPETGKARCRATGECWDCMSCIKVCPTGALQTRMPYQLGYYKASLRPIMGKDCIPGNAVILTEMNIHISMSTGYVTRTRHG